ncbi:MAG: PepSY domain-containing protein [Hyphomicrobiaceae bacterium]
MRTSPENGTSQAEDRPCAARRALLGLFVAMPVLALGSTLFGTEAEAQLRRRMRQRQRRRRVLKRAIRRSERRDPKVHERARAAVRNGEVRPLRDVVAMVRRRSNGRAEILDVDLFQKDKRWVYAIRILTRRGRVRDIVLDGKTLDPLAIE